MITLLFGILVTNSMRGQSREELHMFFKSKKRKENIKICEHKELGGLIKKNNDWVTQKSYVWKMFGEEYSIYFYIQCENDREEITDIQNTAIFYLSTHYSKLQIDSENLLSSFFRTNNFSDIANCIEIEDLNITEKGRICLRQHRTKSG